MIKLQKLSQQELISFTKADFQTSLQDQTKSEMAIPSYLHANPLVRWLMWQRYEIIAGWIDLGENSRVLEFGCGTGLFLPSLCSSGGRIYALDLFPEIAISLSEQNKLKVDFISDLEQIEDGSLDVIVAADVLEHLEEVTSTAIIFEKKLKPDGRLFVSGPTENLAYKMLRIVAGFEGKGSYHFSNINLLVPLIKNCGFSIRREKTLPFPFSPALFRVLEFVKNN